AGRQDVDGRKHFVGGQDLLGCCTSLSATARIRSRPSSPRAHTAAAAGRAVLEVAPSLREDHGQPLVALWCNAQSADARVEALTGPGHEPPIYEAVGGVR